MKRLFALMAGGLFMLAILASAVTAGDKMIIHYKNGKKLTIDTDNVERIDFQAKGTSGRNQGAYGSLSGHVVHIISKNSDKCLDVAGADANNGANVQQWDCHAGANQLWTLTDRGGGYYLIKANHSGRCLDVAGWGKSNGTNVIQYDCHGGDNQLWTPVPQTGGYYLLKSKHSGMCLDVSGVSKDRGANVYQWECHGGDNQLWRLN